MPTYVDTNVILDYVTDDPTWAGWSEQTLEEHRIDGLMVNAVVYAELSVGARDHHEVDRILDKLGIDLVGSPRPALFQASRAFLAYRRQGGTRTTPLPDFFLGADAEETGLPLLTRDPRRYRQYFPEVALICPD